MRRTTLTILAMLTASAGSAATVTADTFTNATAYEFAGADGLSPENVFLPSNGTRAFDIGGVGTTFSQSGASSIRWETTSGVALGTNGQWGAGRNGYVALQNSAPFEMIFEFDTDVSQVGALMNYFGTSVSSVELEIFDALGQSLEIFDLLADAPIMTGATSVDAGAFRGFSRDAVDISKFVVRADFPGATGLVLDDLTLSTYVAPVVSPTSVPVPASLPLLLAGVGVVSMLRRMKR